MRSGRSITVLILITVVVCGVHSAVQGIGAAVFWQPCFGALSFDERPCLWLQYEAPLPIWMYLGTLWFLEVALAIAVVVLLARRPRGMGLAVTALLVVLASNPVTDYALAPLINGGYTSADAAPGFGYTGAALLAIAASLYGVILARNLFGAPSRI